MDPRLSRPRGRLSPSRLALAAALAALAPAAAPAVETTTERADSSGGAVLRGLDKMTGAVTDIPITVGHTERLGRLQITLGDCRYPAENPTGNAYAYLVVREPGEEAPRFTGWMIASAPALSALEHPRYDLWVMRCST